MNHMQRLDALVAVRTYVDAHAELPDDHLIPSTVESSLTMGDLRTIVYPEVAER